MFIRQIRDLCLTAVWPGVGKVAGSQATKVANTVAKQQQSNFCFTRDRRGARTSSRWASDRPTIATGSTTTSSSVSSWLFARINATKHRCIPTCHCIHKYMQTTHKTVPRH